MKYLVGILIALGVWLLFSAGFSPAGMFIGLLVAILTVWALGHYLFVDVHKLMEPLRYFWFVIYLFVFTWECLKANFDVAYRVLHPDLPIKPGIVKVKTNLKTHLARTTLANSITMTPGTITVDIIGDYLYVHWIYVRSADPEVYTSNISGRFEKYLKRIFE